MLQHLTSLPGKHGIGDMGRPARDMIDWLAAAGFRKWQMLPLGPTGYGDSPYQPHSTFAGNPYVIDLDALKAQGLLKAKELKAVQRKQSGPVNFEELFNNRWPLFKTAHGRFKQSTTRYRQNRFREFQKEHAGWLDDWALYAAIKREQGHADWRTWRPELRDRDSDAMGAAKQRLAEDIETHKFVQYQYFEQWMELRAYAKRRNVELIGDLTFYVAPDSADAWAHPDLFKKGFVGGVPGDYFNADGQLWGNPIYAWESNRAGVFAWWKQRLAHAMRLYDQVRIDHFRGFVAYWEIPDTAEYATAGRWRRGPASAGFFDEMKASLAAEGLPLNIVAENLGVITPAVEKERRRLNLPGNLVLQFGLHRTNGHHSPQMISEDVYVYSGTHDNLSTGEHLEMLRRKEQEEPNNPNAQGALRRAAHVVDSFLLGKGQKPSGDPAWDLDRAALYTNADTAMLRLPDMLGLGPEGTMNRPGKGDGNWTWRQKRKLMASQAKEWRALLEDSDRVH